MVEATLHPGAIAEPEEHVLPPLREDIDLYEGARTADGAPTWTLHDPVRNRFFQVGWLEFEILKRWEIGAADKIGTAVTQATPLEATAETVTALERFLRTNQLLQVDGPEARARLLGIAQAAKQDWWRWLLHHYLFIRIPLVHPDQFLTRSLPYVQFFFSRGFFTLVAIAGVLGIYLVSHQWEAFTGSFSYVFSFEGAVLFGVAVFFSKVVHECGHAYTTKHFGARVSTMGIAFLVMWPVLYTDTSESWKLPSRRQRLAIGSAGIAAELALAVFATLLWTFLPDGPLRSAVFFVAAVSWIITLAINLNPFMRWDGYYIFSDLIGIQNLQVRAFPLGRWWLRKQLLGFDEPPPEQLPRKTMRIMLIYSYATWLYRLVLFLGIALVIYHFFFKMAGIALAAVELAFFIGRPIYSELKQWFARRGEIASPRRRWFIAAGLIAVVFFLIPWHTTVVAPAVNKRLDHAQVFAPVAAQVREIHVAVGQSVAAGQLMFVLAAPDLEFQSRQAELRSTVLQSQLRRLAAHPGLLDQRLVLQEQLAEVLAQRAGYAAQLERLRVLAPIDGEVVEVFTPLEPGQWVNTSHALARVVDPGETVVQAYIREADLRRVATGASGRFYPEDPARDPFDVRVVQIDHASTRVLDEPYVASIHGGEVAVEGSATEALIPHNAVYRMRLTPEAGVISPQVVRGTVRVKGQAASLLVRAGRWVTGVLIRETGF